MASVFQVWAAGWRVVLFTELEYTGISLDGRVGGGYLEFKVYMKQSGESPRLDRSICYSAKRSRLETKCDHLLNFCLNV